MNNRQHKTLCRIFETPTAQDIKWAKIESLLLAVGAEVTEAAGSRVRVKLNDALRVLHRPHPSPAVGRGFVRELRDLLTQQGFRP